MYIYGNHRDIQLIHTSRFWLIYIYNYKLYISILVRRHPTWGRNPNHHTL